MRGIKETAMTEDRETGARDKPLLDHLLVLWRWKNFILVNVVLVSVIVAVISLFLPKWYRATASVLPPKQQDLFRNFGGASSLLKGLTGFGGFGQQQSSYNYFAILKSRTANEAVVKKFDLRRVYDISDASMEKTLKELSGNVSFEEQPDDYINIEVLDKDPVRAAEMANYFVEMLNQLSINLATQEARSNRDFIGSRLEESWLQLRQAEEALREYQEESGVMITPEESASLAGIAALYGMKAKKEVELAILKRTTSEDNAALVQTRLELDELNRKISTFPEVGLRSLRLYRTVVIQQKIIEFLTPVYEQARIDEQKDIPVVLVLDAAVPPERKAKPQRMLIVLTMFFLTLFVMIVLVYLMQGIARQGGDARPVVRRMRKTVGAISAKYRIQPDA
jgi:uncharacterized protein involved in exopolysaccharide biosynthesis